MRNDNHKIIEILYTNYRGEASRRKVLPEKRWFGATEWQSQNQWLPDAHDTDKNALHIAYQDNIMIN